jgi:type IV fimbrial biogenesis protein FimT
VLNSIRMQCGMSLIELMIGVALLAFLLFLGVPAFQNFLMNTKVRNAAENVQTGLQLARAEAVRRNVNVRFSLVSDLTSACTVQNGVMVLSPTPPSWVVSLDDPAGACNAAPSDTAAPRIIQKWNALEGAAGVPWAINTSMSTISGGVVATIAQLEFNGLGRLARPAVMAGPNPGIAIIGLQVNSLAVGAPFACYGSAGGGEKNIRCLDVRVTNGGQVRMCDPYVIDTADPRHCG